MKIHNTIRRIAMLLVCLFLLQALPSLSFASSAETHTVTIPAGDDGLGIWFLHDEEANIFNVNVATAGVYELKANVMAESVAYIKFGANGQCAMSTFTSTSASEQNIGYLYLNAGENTIEVSNNARLADETYASWLYCDSFTLTHCPSLEKNDVAIFNLEAEDCTDKNIYIEGTEEYLANERGAYIYNTDHYVTFSFDAPVNGKYEIIMSARNPWWESASPTASGTIALNGDTPAAFSKEYTRADMYEDIVLGEFNMSAGANTFTIMRTGGAFYIDYCKISKTGEYLPDAPSEENKVIEATDKESSSGTVSESDGVLAMTDAEVTYSVEASSYNNYMLSLNCKGTPTRLQIYINDVLFGEKTNVNNTAFSDLRIGGIYLPNGNNTIKINVSGCMELAQLKLDIFDETDMTKTEVSTTPVKVMSRDYTSGTVYMTDYDDVHGNVTIHEPNNYMNYSITVPTDGVYGVYAAYTTGDAGKITATFDDNEEKADEFNTITQQDYVPQSMGAVNLTAGTHTMRINIGGYMQCAFFELREAYSGISYLASFANGEALLNGSSAKRGTDAIDVYFDNDISTSSVTLKEKVAQNSIPCDVSVTGNKLVVKLKETLDYSTEYVLSIGNLKSIYGTDGDADRIIEFTTGDSTGDSGVGTVSVTSNERTGTIATISGVVKSGAGIPVSGRKVTLYNSSDVPVANTISGENGVYTIIYDMSALSMNKYTFTVGDEYTQTLVPVEITYYTDTDKQNLCTAFQTLTTASEIKTALEPYEAVLGVDCSEDVRILTENGGNADNFYLHFANKTFNEVPEVESYYKKYLNFETMVQASNSTMVEAVLGDADNANTLGIDKNITDKIINTRAVFINNVIAIPDTIDVSEYLTDLNAVINDALAAEYSKPAVAPLMTGMTINAGQAASVPLTFTQNLADVKKIDFVVNVTGPTTIGTSNFVAKTGYVGTYSQNGNQITGSVETDSVVSDNSFGTMYISVPSAGNYSVTLTGNITYFVDNVTITVAIPAASATVTATSVSDNQYDGGSGGGGGSFGGYKDYTNQGAQTPVETEYRFEDLGSVLWAEEYIYDLLEKGIISESDAKTYNPHRNTTREEFVKMIVIAMGVDMTSAECNFVDVNASDWHYKYIAAAYNNGLIQGVGDNKFGTGLSITRQDLG